MRRVAIGLPSRRLHACDSDAHVNQTAFAHRVLFHLLTPNPFNDVVVRDA